MSGISWTVLAGLMRALSVFAPMGGKQGEQLQSLLGLVASLLERGEAGRQELEVLCAKVDEMVAQGNRSPTAEELATLQGRSDVAHGAIQEAAKGADPVEEPVADSEPKPEKRKGSK